MQGNFTGNDDIYFFQTEDSENPGSIIWTGEGNAQGEESNVDGLICFSGVSSVQVQNKRGSVELKAIADVRVGDRVLTNKGDYESVYAFAHYSPNIRAEFLQIYTSDSKTPLEISKEHLVYLQGQAHPVRADAIRVGNNLLPSKRVVKVQVVERLGVFAPLTKSGTIVVDGIKASAYADIGGGRNAQGHPTIIGLNSYFFIHMGLSPFRLYCGVSELFCMSYNDDGMPPFVAFGIWISNLASQLPVVAQIPYLAAFAIVTSACTLLELALASRFGFIAVVFLYLKMQNKSLQMSKGKKRVKSC